MGMLNSGPEAFELILGHWENYLKNKTIGVGPILDQNNLI